MVGTELRAAIGVGARHDRVTIGELGGELLEEFGVEHTPGCVFRPNVTTDFGIVTSQFG